MVATLRADIAYEEISGRCKPSHVRFESAAVLNF
nr:MAG TPA: hypothetical protein [Caudoviricetes sp.]